MPTIADTGGTGKPWSITQITGPRKKIILGDYASPFGRPRNGAVVSDPIAVRHQVVYYPGSSKPTRHTFGVRYDDWTLTGRWMNWALGSFGTTANKLAQQMKQLVADQIPVRVEWGDVVAATGLLLEFVPSRESDAEISWKLTIGIDSDDTLPPRPPIPNAPFSPKDQLSQVLQIVAGFPGKPQLPADVPFTYPNNLLSSIDGIVSTINSVTGSLASIANGIDSFERASASELNRFRGGIAQVNTALLTLAAAFDDATNDFAVGASSAGTQTTYASQRAEAKYNALFLLALMSELDVQVQRAQRGREGRTVRSRDGDTWEAISIQQYGSIDGADRLRDANAARYGRKPRPGRIVHIPKS